MSYHCENCHSLFFKTLETRLCAENSAILYKKRCKRCKFKYLVRKPIPNGQVIGVSPVNGSPADISPTNIPPKNVLPEKVSQAEWRLARKINVLPGNAAVSERARILVGEYTQRISNPAEVMSPYLQKIRWAEQRGGAGHGVP